MKLIDTHAHLNYQDLDGNVVVAGMQQDSLLAVINIGTRIKDMPNVVKFAEKNKNIFACIGVHPQDVDTWQEGDDKIIEKLGSNPKVVAIGETGLDLNSNPNNFEQQKKIFIKHLEIANKLQLPVCIHSRDAMPQTIKILKENKNLLQNGGVLHCFQGTEEDVKELTDLGFFISFAGNFTFKKFDKTVALSVPLNRILVETDAPYLSPEPLRGKWPNSPKNVHITAEALAAVLGENKDTFKQQTVKNALTIFKKMKIE